MDVRVSAHSAYCLQYHVVWVCKYRRRILKPGVAEYLRKVLMVLLRQMPGVEIEAIGFDGDHLHMVMIIPPNPMRFLLMRLKTLSSNLLQIMMQLRGQSPSGLKNILTH